VSLSACPTLTWMRAGHPCAHAYVDACRAPLRAAMSIRRRAGGLLCQPRENHTHTIQLYSQAPRCQAPARLLTPPPLRGGSGPTDMGQAEAKEIIAQQQERDLNPTQIVDRFGSAGFSKPQLDAGPAVTYGLQTNAQLKRVRPVATPSTLWGECYRPALRCRHFLPVSPSPRLPVSPALSRPVSTSWRGIRVRAGWGGGGCGVRLPAECFVAGQAAFGHRTLNLHQPRQPLRSYNGGAWYCRSGPFRHSNYRNSVPFFPWTRWRCPLPPPSFVVFVGALRQSSSSITSD